MWTKIINPNSGRQVSIYGKLGKKILTNYLIQIGGSESKKEVGTVVYGVKEKSDEKELFLTSCEIFSFNAIFLTLSTDAILLRIVERKLFTSTNGA